MVAQLINVDPKAIQLTQVQGSQLSQVLPVLSVGQILPITIRQNDAGNATVALRGQLMEAKVPPELKEGSQVFVQLTQADKQVVFKLLTDIPSRNAQQTQSGFQQLAENLQKTVATKLQGFEGFVLPEPKNLPEGIKEPLAQLIKTFNFEGSEKFTSDLRSLAQGKVPTELRQLIDTAGPNSPAQVRAPLVELLTNLKAGLEVQLNYAEQGEPLQLAKLFRSVELFTLDPTKVPKADRPQIESFLREFSGLKAAETKIDDALRNLLGKVDKLIEQHSVAGRDKVPNSESLKEVVTKLENVARAQEGLALLNPVMQAIGEPALVLFPLLLNGLLNSGELVVDPPPKEKVDGDEESEDGANSEGYQRVSLTVPLANIGPVQVDIAHRKDELLASITLEDPEAAAFLYERLEGLATELRKFGFKNAEITANVGPVKEVAPEWTNTLRKAVSIVA